MTKAGVALLQSRQRARQVLPAIEAYLLQHSMAHSTFGLRVANMPMMVTYMRRGRGISQKTYDKIKKYMADTEA